MRAGASQPTEAANVEDTPPDVKRLRSGLKVLMMMIIKYYLLSGAVQSSETVGSLLHGPTG